MEYKKISWGWKSIGGISDIVGKVPVKIETDQEDYIFMQFSDNNMCRFYHEQDCCESVTIEDVNGDWQDLIGNPILVADERSNHDESVDYESVTWTFYTFRGIGGSVDVRWCGSSNGYYSESFDFQMIEVK
jgi:hypothetical protein